MKMIHVVRKMLSGIVGVVLVTGLVSAQADYRASEVIVKYKEGFRRDRKTMEQIYDAAGVVKVKRFPGTHQLEQLILSEKIKVEDAIDALERSPYVEYAEPNTILHVLPVSNDTASTGGPRGIDFSQNPPGGIPCVPGLPIPGCAPGPCLAPNFPPGCTDKGPDPTPPMPPPAPVPTPAPAPQPPDTGRAPVADKPSEVNPPVADPELAQAWGISKIGSVDAWKITQGSSKMVVAVIDTGVDYNHEDLSFNMWRNPNPDAKTNDLVGFDFVHNDGLPFDDHSHGSHCSGVIGAVGGNGKGISGVNQRVSIMGVKFLSAEGSGDEAGAIRAIDYAVSHGANVLSNSWGGSGDGDMKGLKDAVARAEVKGVLFIAAAGNDSSDNDTTPEFPGGFNTANMIAVAATDSSDGMASFSNYGKTTVHVGAPGVDVFSSVPANKYGKMSGTSMACPHVAGAAALLWSAHRDWTYKQVKDRLIETVDKIPALAGKTLSGGRINVLKALQ